MKFVDGQSFDLRDTQCQCTDDLTCTGVVDFIGQHVKANPILISVTRRVVLTYCEEHTSLAGAMVRMGFFPSADRRVAFSLDLLDLYRQLLLSSGLSKLVFIQAISAIQDKDFDSMYKHFISTMTEYTHTMFNTETLLFMDMQHLFKGCYSCPSKGQIGPLNLAADGNFRSFSYAKNHVIPDSLLTSHFMLNQPYMKDKLEEAKKQVKLKPGDIPCSNFRALEGQATGKFKSLNETGMFGICCARHETILCATDMFSEERFAYLDTLLELFLEDVEKDRPVNVFYDIGCKFERHVEVSHYVSNNRS